MKPPPPSTLSSCRRLSPGQKQSKDISIKKEEDSITNVYSAQLEVNSIKQKNVHSGISMDSIQYKEQLIDRLYHDDKPTLKKSYNKGHISTTDYKFELDNLFLTIKSYSEDIAKWKDDILHINTDNATNANNICDLNLSHQDRTK